MMDRGLSSDQGVTTIFREGTASHERATADWANPSRSYPYLAISRRFEIPYDVVLAFSDYLQGRLTPTQDMSLENRLKPYIRGQHDWQRAVHSAIRAFLKIQREGM